MWLPAVKRRKKSRENAEKVVKPPSIPTNKKFFNCGEKSSKFLIIKKYKIPAIKEPIMLTVNVPTGNLPIEIAKILQYLVKNSVVKWRKIEPIAPPKPTNKIL